MDENTFINHQLQLLALEREEEQTQRQDKYNDASLRIFQRLQSRGDAILNLSAEKPTDSSTSLEGHTLIILRKTHGLLPSHKFTSGF